MNTSKPSARRAPRGYTYEPCPGCGAGGDHIRPRNGVCGVCANDIAWARQERENAVRRTEAADRKVPVAFPPVSHWLPYLPEKGTSNYPIRHAFHAVVMSVTETPARAQLDVARAQLPDDSQGIAHLIVAPRGGYASGGSWMPGRMEDYRVLDAHAAPPLSALYDAIRQGLEAAFREGVQYGRSLLFQLNDGALSTDDFTRRLAPYAEAER